MFIFVEYILCFFFLVINIEFLTADLFQSFFYTFVFVFPKSIFIFDKNLIMVKEFIKQWDENKHLLERYFAITPQIEYSDYKDIVKKIFELVITEQEFDTSKLTVIDDGDYQGTQLFIIPLDTYQPSKSDYVITDNEYGSCSGCDTLQSIHDYGNGLPTQEQVKEYMTLSLHLIQKLNWL